MSSEILKTWITIVTGDLVQMETIIEGCSNGYLIANILYKYSVIKLAEFNWIKNNHEEETLNKNFKMIQNWLKDTDIKLTDEIVDELKSYNANTATFILYQIYLCIKDNSVLSYQAEYAKKNQRIYSENHRFEVKGIKKTDDEDETEEEICDNSRTHENLKLIQNLSRRNKHVVHWYHQQLNGIDTKLKEVKEACRKRFLNLHQKYPITEKVKDVDALFTVSSISSPTITSVSSYTKKVEEFEPLKEKPKGIFKKIKDKHAEKSDHDKFVAKVIQNLLIRYFQDVLTELNDQIYDKTTKKLLKQSQYEKQMVQKLHEAYKMKFQFLDNHVMHNRIEIEVKSSLELTLSKKDKDLKILRNNLYHREIDKTLVLYEKLTTNKEQLPKQRNYEFCMDVTTAIFNYAMKHIEFYKLYNLEPEARHFLYWKACFVKDKPLQNFINDVTELTYYNDNEEQDMEKKELYRLEMDKHIAMRDAVMEDYAYRNISFYRPVDEEYPQNEELINKTDTIVAKLLRTFKTAKYPKQVEKKPTDLPDFKLRACVIGITELTIVPLLRKLLKDNNIAVIQIADAINYCMKAYVEEDEKFFVEKNFTEITNETFDWLYNRKKNPMFKDKNKVWRLEGTTKLNNEDLSNVKQQADKQTQLTSNNDENMIQLSTKAQLGKLAYQYLYLGCHLPNKTVISMFVEYLKSLGHYNGWLLIDYPTTFKDAGFMEEKLTGVKYHFPYNHHTSVEDIIDTELRNLHVIPSRDPGRNKRKVALFREVEDQEVADPYYETHFTSFIEVRQTIANPDRMSFQIDKEDLTNLREFYSNKGIYYLYQCNIMTHKTIQEFVKFINQLCTECGSSPDFLTDEKEASDEEGSTWVQLGEKLERPKPRFDYNETPPLDEKKSKKKEKGNKNKRGKGKDKTSTIIAIKKEHKGTQLPEIDDDSVQSLNQINTINTVKVILPIPFQIMLASVWEKVEQIFCNNLTSLLFKYRCFMEDHEKFCKTTNDMMKTFLERPHHKQYYLEQFQISFNNFEQEYRSDEEVKAEYFCRIDDLRKQLKEITEQHHQDSIAYKKKLMENKCMIEVIIIYANGHTSLSHTELIVQRLLLQILNDYYVGVVTKMPCNKLLKDVTTLEEVPATKYDEFLSYLSKCLNQEELPNMNNCLSMHLDKNYKTSLALIEEYKSHCFNHVKEMEGIYKKREKSEKFNQEATEIFPDLINEWKEITEGLYMKCHSHLTALTTYFKGKIFSLLRSYADLSLTLNILIQRRYQNEMDSLMNACSVFSNAIESEVAVQQRLVLEQDKFYIDPNIQMFLDLIPSTKMPQEIKNSYWFPIDSLYKIIDVFRKIAPKSILPERYFTFILYDIVTNETNIYVPTNWRRLSLKDISEIVSLLFEKNPYIKWYDFILYNLNVSFPKVTDILRARRHFQKFDPDGTEIIPFYHLINSKFWINKTKEYNRNVINLLCKLYEVKNEYVNYTAMLLGFCKDHDPLKGFLKAVQLCLGTLVCTDFQEGELYLQKVYNYQRGRRFKTSSNNNLSKMDGVMEESLNEEIDEEFSIANMKWDYSESSYECSIEKESYSSIIKEESVENSLELESDDEVIYEECDSSCKCENTEDTYDWADRLSSCACSYDTICSEKAIFVQDEFVRLCEICDNYDSKLPVIYSIPYEVFMKIVAVTLLPQQSVKNSRNTYRKKIRKIYDDSKISELEDKVFTHVLFNNTDFKKFVNKRYEFLQKSIERILNSVIKSVKNSKR